MNELPAGSGTVHPVFISLACQEKPPEILEIPKAAGDLPILQGQLCAHFNYVMGVGWKTEPGSLWRREKGNKLPQGNCI